jgi:hypothetical protein
VARSGAVLDYSHVTFNALVSTPGADREQAVLALWDQLRQTTARVAAGSPDRSTLVVQEPVEVADALGRPRYLWLATAEASQGWATSLS